MLNRKCDDDRLLYHRGLFCLMSTIVHWTQVNRCHHGPNRSLGVKINQFSEVFRKKSRPSHNKSAVAKGGTFGAVAPPLEVVLKKSTGSYPIISLKNFLLLWSCSSSTKCLCYLLLCFVVNRKRLHCSLGICSMAYLRIRPDNLPWRKKCRGLIHHIEKFSIPQ